MNPSQPASDFLAPNTNAERRILEAMDKLHQGAAIFDQDGRLTGFNKTYAGVWPDAGRKLLAGMSRREVAALIWDNGGGWPDENRASWIEKLSSDDGITEGPVESALADGRLLKIQRVRFDGGNILTSLTDITASANRSASNEKHARLYQQVALSVADWVWKSDAHHCFVPPSFASGKLLGNLSFFLGRTRWDALGIDPDSYPEWRAHKETLQAHQPFRDFRYGQELPDGSLRWARISGNPLFDSAGVFKGFVGVGVDETPLAEADARAGRAETLVQEAVDNLSEGMVVFDRQGNLFLWNKALERIYGMGDIQIRAGTSFEDLTRLLASSGLFDLEGMSISEWSDRRNALQRPNPVAVEREISGRWYQIRETVMTSGSMAILLTDITNLKHQQEALIQARDGLEARVADRTRSLADAVARAEAETHYRGKAEAQVLDNEQKFRSIAEGVTQGFFVQHDFQLRWSNTALADMLGYTSIKEMQAVGSIEAFIAPSVRDELRNRNTDRAAGRPAPSRYETLFLRKDGREIPVEVFISKIVWEGVPSILVSVVDMEDQHRAMTALAEAERDYRTIFEQASDGIYRSTLDGGVLRANPALARMNGFASEQDLRGARVEQDGSWYVEPGRREEFVRIMRRDGQVQNFVSEVYRYKTKERMWISENARLIRDTDGEPLYFEGTVRDITDQRRVEMELRQAILEAEGANEAKSQFLAKMSHELRTPLNAVIGFSEIISGQMMGPVGTDRYIDYANDIQESGHHLLLLINDLLDLSKIESGEMQLDLQSIRLSEIAQESAALIAPLADPRRISVRLEMDDQDIHVLADRRSLKQMLLNLLSNAVKFNRDGGWIAVQAAAQQGICRIDIVDSGIGIDKSDLHTLFTPFGQVSSQLVADHRGTGLGLPIVKSLVELHGGAISVRSRPGEGTTLTIELPLAA